MGKEKTRRRWRLPNLGDIIGISLAVPAAIFVFGYGLYMWIKERRENLFPPHANVERSDTEDG